MRSRNYAFFFARRRRWAPPRSNPRPRSDSVVGSGTIESGTSKLEFASDWTMMRVSNPLITPTEFAPATVQSNAPPSNRPLASKQAEGSA